MLHLRQSTASQNVLLGRFVDATDGVTPEPGLTIANTDILLSKNGATSASKNSGGGTHDAAGMYQITLDATDTDTVGRLQVHCNVAGAAPVYHEFQVLEESVYDNFYESGAELENSDDIAAKLGHLVTTTIATLASQTSFTLTAGSADDDAYNGALLVCVDQTTGTQRCVGYVSDYTGSTRTVTLAADPGIFTMATGDTVHIVGVPPQIGEILTDTAEIGAAGAGLTEAGGTGDQLTAVPWNAAWDTEVQSECIDALGAYNAVATTDLPPNFAALSISVTTGRVDVASIEGTDATDQINAACDASIETYGLDHLVSAAVAGTDVADNSVFARIVSGSATADWDDFVNTTDSLQAIRDSADTDHAQTQSDIAGLNDVSAAQVNTEVVDALNTDAYAEPGTGAPPATASIATKIGYLYKLMRNRITQTSTTLTVYNDDATTAGQQATVSDNGTTYDRGEIGSA